MIRWKPSREGFTESHCGLWKISPRWWGRVAPTGYVLERDGKRVGTECRTQSEAKARAALQAAKE